MLQDLITFKNPKSPTAEAYRTLRTNLQFSNVDGDLKTIVITSAGPAEGKTTTATNMAETFAQTGQRVLIIDGDLRRPRVHKVFKLSNKCGLTTVLSKQAELQDVIHTAGSDISILCAGPIPPNPSELLGSNAMDQLLQNLQNNYDIIIIDTPPVGIVTDAAILAAKVDGVILTVASGTTHIDGAKMAKKQLEAVKANILGCVMTMMPVSKKGYYGVGYKYYGYDEAQTSRKRRRKIL